MNPAEPIERLREAEHGDHSRGCEGRQYTCSCGYDHRIQTAATEAADTLAANVKAFAEIRAENERWCDAAQATSAKLTAANEEIVRMRKAMEAGRQLANAAYNIGQRGSLDQGSLKSLVSAGMAWDTALTGVEPSEMAKSFALRDRAI